MTENDAEKQLRAVLNAASAILTFSDNTESKLREKLSKKCFDDDLIDVAMVRLKEKGLVNDERLMGNVVEYLANTKLYGKGRLKIELLKKGFSKETVSENFENAVVDIDFKENCLKLVKRKGMAEKFADRETRQKVSASLVRHGFGYPEIKYALIRVLEENE